MEVTRQTKAEPSPLGCLIGLGMIAALWMPWGHLSLNILGVRPSLTFKGTQIGSDIGEIPWGWFFAAAGLVFFLASCRGAVRLMSTAATGATVFAVINAVTLSGSTPHASISIGGETQSLDTELKPDVSLAWGAYAVLFLAAAALLVALAARREGQAHHAL